MDSALLVSWNFHFSWGFHHFTSPALTHSPLSSLVLYWEFPHLLFSNSLLQVLLLYYKASDTLKLWHLPLFLYQASLNSFPTFFSLDSMVHCYNHCLLIPNFLILSCSVIISWPNPNPGVTQLSASALPPGCSGVAAWEPSVRLTWMNDDLSRP